MAGDDTPTVVAPIVPSIEAAYGSSNRDIANVRCLVILNELGHNRDQHGEEATGIEDLKLPAKETLNPFTGQPLVVELTANGWHIGPTASEAPATGKDREWGLSP